MKTHIAGCCKKEITEEEFILNHGLCSECMDKGVAESNERQRQEQD